VNLPREVEFTNFNHFSMGLSGMRIVARHEKGPNDDDLKIFVGAFSPGENPRLKVQYLLSPKWAESEEGFKPRPFFSPDEQMVFFHSDVDGPSQIFMAEGYEFPAF
jgi:hypothetical protein